MTEHELNVLLGFLTGGLLAGFVGHGIDLLVAFIRR